VKLFCLPITGIIVGGVVVAPRASELIHAIAVAVAERVTVESFSHALHRLPVDLRLDRRSRPPLHGHAEEPSITS